ncbi:aquaporin-4-like isoform X2 [Denticeps clupeoides]|uniref:aquaporin-4-like isoform X2 n=1 Tax=Denticeps clupeoides TaxID=299321 RepID=UPI0010A32131|nr:aquaporin-4 isoform X2 [Denticeps clupeoides]
MCARCCASSPRPALAALRCWQRIMVAFKGVCTKPFWRAVSAEFLATLIFVLLSLGSTISWPASEGSASPVNLVLISLCFGLSIATMVQCFGHISGGHLNPAVTVAMVVTRKLSLAKATFYLSAQCLGAIAGAGILYLVTPSSVRGGLGVTMVNSNITVGHALVVETVITFELIFTVFATCDPKRTDQNGSAGLAIGLSVAIGHFFAMQNHTSDLETRNLKTHSRKTSSSELLVTKEPARLNNDKLEVPLPRNCIMGTCI